ncbi:MAG: alpha/beta fold hydrolase [Deltaproteobacteria bacterium]|nr:alpha/beta fold hydrolase [Candidatus Zymogenaceae bacterium]
MNTPPRVMAGAEPFELAGKDKAVLLLHGLTGTPSEMRFLGEYLHRAGYHVRAPLLPGHGTDIKDLNKTTWRDWFGRAEIDFLALSAHFPKVFIAGMSMGGLLCLSLMANKFGRITGGAALATPMAFSDWKARCLLPVAGVTGLKYLIPDLPKAVADVALPGGRTHVCYERDSVIAAVSILRLMKRVRTHLPMVEDPLLIMQSVNDTVVAHRSADIIYGGVSSAVKEKVMLQRSYHTITVDVEKELVAKTVLEFFEKQL